MKTFLISTILLLAISLYSTAQNLITVQNGSKVQFYTSLDSAYVHSADGDTLYLPGGSYSPPAEINKSIHIIGVGHNPDSTSATNFTLINGSIDLRQGASNGSLTGVYLTGNILLTDTIYNYSVERCNVGDLSLTTFTHNNSFVENVIRTGVYGGNSSNNLFFNNIFNSHATLSYTNTFGGFNAGTEFKNNIIFGPISQNSYSIIGTIFENNIFIGGDFYYPTNCVFSNNLVDSTGYIRWDAYGNTHDSNLINQGVGSIFVKYTGGGSFKYTDNYHLKSGSPGKNAGKDGTDIGIYGGVFPWKEGSVPFNPHIISSTIANKTNSDGTLHVSIKVEAQHR